MYDVHFRRVHVIALVVGVAAYVAAMILVPGEIRAAKRRDKIGARTAVTFVLFGVAALATLGGTSAIRLRAASRGSHSGSRSAKA